MPYGKVYPRVVDFLPNLSLQDLVHKQTKEKLEYGYGEIVASIGKNKIKFDPIKTDVGCAEVDSTDSTRIRFFFGDPDPMGLPDVRLSPNQIISDLNDNVVGGIPELQDCFADAVLREAHVLEPIPKSLLDDDMFGDLDEIKLCQKACGNHNKRYGKFAGMNFINPYQHARMGLMQNHNLLLNHEQSTRIRSTEVTTSLCGFNGDQKRDYTEFGVDGVTKLQKHITQKRWWQDMATFFPFPHYDYIYCLNREKKYMPLVPL